MTRYKITNITNLLGKREFKNNSILDIEYVDGMLKKKIQIRPNETIYLSLNKLPISIHKLRIKGLVTVTEISEKELNNAMNNKKKILSDIEEENKKTKKPGRKKIQPAATKKRTYNKTKKDDEESEKIAETQDVDISNEENDK